MNATWTQPNRLLQLAAHVAKPHNLAMKLGSALHNPEAPNPETVSLGSRTLGLRPSSRLFTTAAG